MKFYLLEPEVAGGIGENTEIMYENHKIKEVTRLHYEFEGWLGDDLLTTSPCFIVTERLEKEILKSDLTGYRFEAVEISTSETFKELYPQKELPNFKRLVPLGKVAINGDKIVNYSNEDFLLEKGVELFVSEKALNLFRKFNLSNCDITEFSV